MAVSKSRQEAFMKIKIAAFLMLSAALSYSQTFTRTKPDPEPAPSPDLIAQIEAKSSPEHCPMMKDSKNDMACCAHQQDGSAKSDMSCCQGKDGKDAMACMKGDKSKTAASCCAGGKCAHTGKAGCCTKSEKTTEQAGMACCGAGAAHCAMHGQGE
jgi:hypothetical protein